MFETGIRMEGPSPFQVDDVDLDGGRVAVRRGKGGRAPVIPIGAAAGAPHRRVIVPFGQPSDAATPRSCGSASAEPSSATTVSAGRSAGAPSSPASTGFHPHKLRHTAAHRWLAAGGSESGLMAMAGWTRTDMLVRYTRATPPNAPPRKPSPGPRPL